MHCHLWANKHSCKWRCHALPSMGKQAFLQMEMPCIAIYRQTNLLQSARFPFMSNVRTLFDGAYTIFNVVFVTLGLYPCYKRLTTFAKTLS